MPRPWELQSGCEPVLHQTTYQEVCFLFRLLSRDGPPDLGVGIAVWRETDGWHVFRMFRPATGDFFTTGATP